MKIGYDYIFRGLDGLERIRIVDKKHVGLAKIDERNKVVGKYKKFRDFFSRMVFGKVLSPEEFEHYTIGGYYKDAGVNFKEKVIIYDTNKIEGYDIENNLLKVKINFGDKSYKDVEVIEHDLNRYDSFKVANFIILTEYSSTYRYFVKKIKFN